MARPLIVNLIVVISGVFGSAPICASQNQNEFDLHIGSSYEDSQTKELKGLSAEEMLKSYGPPDSKDTKGTQETWHYGDSLVLFSTGRVAAWADEGTLAERRVVTALSVPEKELSLEEELKLERGWSNAWTIAPRLKAEEVIDEIVNASTN